MNNHGLNHGLIVGGMPDTMEFYTLFHMALKMGGVFEMLLTVFILLVDMVVMQLLLSLSRNW